MMRPSSSTTRMPSSIVLKRVSRKLRSRARRWTTVCRPSASSRPIRPSTLSRKLDLPAAIAQNKYSWSSKMAQPENPSTQNQSSDGTVGLLGREFDDLSDSEFTEIDAGVGGLQCRELDVEFTGQAGSGFTG